MDHPGGPEAGCALCGRAGLPLTAHHLIPRALHRRKWVRHRFGSEEPKRRVVDLCHPCHRHIHATLTEAELARSYNTVADLLAHPEIRRFVDWIATKPAGFHARSRTTRRKRG